MSMKSSVLAVAALLSSCAVSQQPSPATKPESTHPAAAAPAAVAAAAPAATPPATVPIVIQGNQFTLPVGEVTLEDLLVSAARFLDRNLMWSPGELAGAIHGSTFTFRRALTLDATACEEVLCNLLYMKGLVLLPLDPDRGIYEVVNLNGQRAREVSTRAPWRSPEEVLKRPNLKEPVLTTVQLKHINATIATNALRPFFAQAGSSNGGGLTFGTAGNNSAILLQGFRDQVAGAIRLLHEVDVPVPVAQMDAVDPLGELRARIAELEQQVAKLKKAADGERK